ncbi:unnamed protein product [Clonostachys byssicola]|uniref:Aminotransferase class I/classII large domain-containing protein n=1 Tax=Clonostachys byssicola TaxID=160290 RepID=A0A9N9U3G3_9HYPO|nr:unnamed protein product [Clonostachys byssicola]
MAHGALDEKEISPIVQSPVIATAASSEVGTKPKATCLQQYFSEESRNFQGSALKKTTRLISNFLPLGTGRPHAELYPWTSGDANWPTFLNKPNGSEGRAGVPSTYTLANALTYGTALGAPPLVQFLTEHMRLIHNPPYQDWAVCLTCGSTSALDIIFRTFTNRGDIILAEKYSYPGIIESAALAGVEIQPVDLDDQGLSPDKLGQILDQWNTLERPKPKVLYTIPSGQNPTGVTQSQERRRAIYEIAERHGLIIVEDDPYYFIQLGPNATSDGSNPEAVSRHLVPSYFSIDKSGRVIRLDSTSKILAPGLRAGWVTASRQVIDKYAAYHDLTTVSVSGLSQIVLHDLFNLQWGQEGFSTWLQTLSLKYTQRRDITVAACHSFLPSDICSFVIPDHGMFLWISIDVRKHPMYAAEGHMGQGWCSQVEDRILTLGLANGVQVTKGSLFFTKKSSKEAELFFRLTFAAAKEHDLAEGVRIFANAVKTEFNCRGSP